MVQLGFCFAHVSSSDAQQGSILKLFFSESANPTRVSGGCWLWAQDGEWTWASAGAAAGGGIWAIAGAGAEAGAEAGAGDGGFFGAAAYIMADSAASIDRTITIILKRLGFFFISLRRSFLGYELTGISSSP